MYLSRLEIQGFKSFANNTKLDFQRGITAIVGPNGSGKSNVADAIRWVLGEQSLKVLRGKRSDDVIFAGSDKKSRLGVAEVSLYLNNEDKSAPVEYAEFVITRRVYRDGEGEYLINRQPARLQDIQLLLAQANFGQRTYSVIAQGMIDSFLLSTPQERKHLFDEAAGVRQYQLKKDQALSKLYQTKENLSQGEAIMQEIEPRLRSLTRQVKRLERRDEIEKDLRAKQRQFFGIRWQELQTELRHEKSQQAVAQKKHDTIAGELATIQEELDAIERERSSSEIFIGLQKTYNTILDEKNRLLQEQAVVKGKLELAGKEPGGGTLVYEQRADQLKQALERLAEDQDLTAQELKRAQAAHRREAESLKKIDQRFSLLEKNIATIKQRWDASFTWPQAQAAIGAFFEKYHEFVELLHEQEDFDHASVRNQAAKLRDELEALVQRLETGDDAANPQSLMDLQQQAVEVAKERQAALAVVMEHESQVKVIDHRATMQAEERARISAELKQAEAQSKLETLAKEHPDQAQNAYAKEAKRVATAVAEADARLLEARNKMNDFTSAESAKKERLFSLQKSFRDTQQHLNHASHEVNELQVKMARLEQRRDDLHREMVQAMDETAAAEVMRSTEELSGDVTLLAEEIGHLAHQLQLIGGIDEQTTQEYQDTNERWEFLNKQAEDLRAGILQLENAIGELDGTIKKKFDTAFKKINEEFNQYFRTLFRGGKAELALIQEVPLPPKQVKIADDEDDDEDDEDDIEIAPAAKGEKVIVGIDIKATPPGKKLQGIAMLSGGERALTSIALLCAIISNNPSPFVTLDEVDAALDEANSQRFAAILDHLAKKSQFITITHNRATMEKAQLLYGVTMGEDGVSQLLSVKMDEAEKIIQQHGNR